MKNKCPKTLSGKHIFKEYYDGIDEEKTKIEQKKLNKKGYRDSFMYVPKIIKKCSACGMIKGLD